MKNIIDKNANKIVCEVGVCLILSTCLITQKGEAFVMDLTTERTLVRNCRKNKESGVTERVKLYLKLVQFV